MKQKMVALALALATAVSVSACQTPQQQNAVVGGALGAGTGLWWDRRCRAAAREARSRAQGLRRRHRRLIGSAATPQPT